MSRPPAVPATQNVTDPNTFALTPIGHVRSFLSRRADAPLQGHEGAPEAELEISPAFAEALRGLECGQDIWVLTWLHESQRETLLVHPRNDARNPLTGVFATRSLDRPNPIGLHRTTLLRITGCRLHVQALEAIEGTPILDIKPVLRNFE